MPSATTVEELCTAFIAGSRAHKELHHTVHMQNVTPSMMEQLLFPKAEQTGIAEDNEGSLPTETMSLTDALQLLNLTDLPETRGQLYMATYARMKESEESDDENFPTKAELRQARDICKAAFDCDTK